MKIQLTALLLLLGTAEAFSGITRPDWLGESITRVGWQPTTKKTVYIFTRPDCGSCSGQLASLAYAQKQNPALDVRIIVQKNDASVREHLSGFNLKATILEDISGNALKAFLVKKIPATVWVDTNGSISAFYEGDLSSAETAKFASAFINNKKLPAFFAPGSVGSPAPELEGVEWKKSKNHLIIFHSANCHYCKEQLPHLLEFAKNNPKVAVWIVSSDSPQLFEQQFGGYANIRLLQDPKIYGSYRVQGTPTQILVDNTGVIRWRQSGFHATNYNPFVGKTIPLQ